MFGELAAEREVNVPATDAWKVYGTIQLAKVAEAIPNLFDKMEIVEGNGGPGTVIKLTFPPESGFPTYQEKITAVDDERQVKETEVVDGGYLDLGFTLFRVRLEVIDKDEKSCITKATIEYEVKDEAAANASLVSIQPLVTLMEAVASYLTQ